MSVTVDVNVLVYASNEDDPAHKAAAALVERLAAGSSLLYLFWPTLLGYMRVVTHPSILPQPLAPRAAARNIERLLAFAHVRTPGEGDDFWRHLQAVTEDRARGNDLPDAHIAALMRQHEVRIIYTRDRGFRRFADVEVRNPLG